METRKFKCIELFAGAGGLALGLERAGLDCIMLNEIDHDACNTLRANRPKWNVIEDSIENIDFSNYKEKAEVLTGGFPCQSFSYAGKRLGFEDSRGALFNQFLRAVEEVRPLIAVGENVRGLLSHNGGNTISSMISSLESLGYRVVEPKVLKAVLYKVPQKRERLFIVALREDVLSEFEFPKEHGKTFNLSDALKKGELFGDDVPVSIGQKYPESKKEVLDLVPAGGCWRDLPIDIQKSYMKKSFFCSGGKTGIARRISWDEPCLTLTCSPAQKQTDRCHPDETRPFTVREYARIQTFYDDWVFCGSMNSQYKQIGNAVPVNLAYYIGTKIVECLENI